MRILVSLALLSALATGCDQLTATVSATSAVTSIPDLTGAENLAGSGLLGSCVGNACTVGGGTCIDDDECPDILPLSSIGVRAGTAALAGVGERESSTSTAAPEPLSGARVQISWSGHTATLCEATEAGTPGIYEATSFAGDSCYQALEYVEGAVYHTYVETGTDLYSMAVTAPAPIDPARIELTPQLTVPSDHDGVLLPKHGKNTALTVDWSADTASGDRYTFVTVARIRYLGGGDATSPSAWQADPSAVWDDFPSNAAEMIAFVTAEPKTSATVEATFFDQTGVYFLVVTATEMSDDVSANLFLIGSGALAGIGTAIVFWVD